MAAPTATTPTEQLMNTAFLHSTLFWTVAAFFVMFYILWKHVVPALQDTLDKRASRIREDLDNAAVLRSEAQQALTAYEKQLRAARKEAQDIVAHAKADAERLVASKTAELERDLSRRSEEARVSIEQAKNRAMNEVREQIASLAVVAAERIIAANIDEKKAAQITDEALKGLKH